DVVGRRRRVSRRRIDVAPALDAVAGSDANEHAALHGGDAVHAPHRLAEGDVHQERVDVGDLHPGYSRPPLPPWGTPSSWWPSPRWATRRSSSPWPSPTGIAVPGR